MIPSRRRTAFGLAIVATLVLAVLGMLRPSLERTWGDEPTYLAMARSLALDYDLRFTEGDLAREQARGAADLILERTGRGIFYSKPVLYPLLGAPFARVLGAERGLVAFNAIALLAALALAWRHLARLGQGDEGGLAALTLVTFAGTSVLVPYVMWRMSSALEAALVIAGIVLARSSGRAAWIGAALLGLGTSLRYPHAVFALVPVVAALVARKPKRAVALALVAGVAFAGVMVATFLLTGAADPYHAVRSGFSQETGYPVGPDAAVALARFENKETIGVNAVGLLPRLSLGRALYSAFYFVVGRHTGVALYTPAIFLLAWVAIRRRDAVSIATLGASAILAGFLLVWNENNYFGGASCLGNRYFLPAYAALFAALPALPRPRAFLFPWIVAALTSGSAVLSIVRTREAVGRWQTGPNRFAQTRDHTSSQSHASAGIFRLFPYESTAIDLEGRTDRYWSGDFVRFVDPFAEVGGWDFTLRSDRPPAELEIATERQNRVYRFLLTTASPTIELHERDWLRHRVTHLSGPNGASGVVEVRVSPSWRRHAFWWADASYTVRTPRLSIVAPGGAPAVAAMHYLGSRELPPFDFSREVVTCDLPESVIGGTTSSVSVGVRNKGSQAWSSQEVLPVHLAYRLRPLTPPGDASEGGRTDLPAPVSPGGELRASVAVYWPAAPGEYELSLDLVREGVAWFADRTGEPLCRGRVQVASAP